MPVEVITDILPDSLEEIINANNRYVLLHVVPVVTGQQTYTNFTAIFQAPPPPVEAEAGFIPVVEVDQSRTPVARLLSSPVVRDSGYDGGRKSRRRRSRKQKKSRKH